MIFINYEQKINKRRLTKSLKMKLISNLQEIIGILIFVFNLFPKRLNYQYNKPYSIFIKRLLENHY
jgi:hypothetical protein